MNMIFRPSAESDLEAIYALALQSGNGITTLPKDRHLLHQSIKLSIASFQKNIDEPYHEYYLFVIEDIKNHHIAGTAAIESKTGIVTPFYSYRYTNEIQRCLSLNTEVTHRYLNLSYENEGYSEICTLYLEPKYRHNGNGLLLSLSRFLFIKAQPHRFTRKIIAEMRGISDEFGHSPFWDAVGQIFFNMSFMEADQLTLSSNKQFIADLIPKHTIYLNLLPQEAQQIIGEAHPSSMPAMRILVREGFYYNHTVDIFDAGPTLEAYQENIRTIAESRVFTVCLSNALVNPQRVLIANHKLDFRAMISFVSLDMNQNLCFLSSETGEHLNCEEGESIVISFI